MGVFRSEPMRIGTLVLPKEGARDFVVALGTNVQIQIQDMNGASFARGYKRQMQRLEELERILRYLVSEIERIAELSLSQIANELDRTADAAAAAAADAAAAKPQVYVLDKVEEMLNKVYQQFQRFSHNNQELQREKVATEEELAVVSFAASQLRSAMHSSWIYTPRSAAAAAATAAAEAAAAAAARSSSSCCSSSNLRQQQTNTATADSHERSSSARRRRFISGEAQQQEQQQAFEVSASRSLLPQHYQPIDNPELSSLVFSTVAGIILAKDQERFARAMFRATRGNAFTHFKRLEEAENAPHASQAEAKSLFVTYFQGSASGSAFMEKVKCVCGAMGARMYNWPRSGVEAQQRQQQLLLLLQDKAAAAAAYEQYFLNEVGVFLESVPAAHMPPTAAAAAAAAAATASPGDATAAAAAAAAAAAGTRRRPLIVELGRFVSREKAVYTALNLFALSDATLRADCWFPEAHEGALRQTLATVAAEKNTSAFLLLHVAPSGSSGSSGGFPGGSVPPTLFQTTSFLSPFQGLVDMYGIARYREANPALFAAGIFPFLFGVMFGDVGHGFVLLLLALGLIFYHKNGGAFQDELLQGLLNARFMVLSLSVHSIFAGFMYNDIFSMGLNLFGSRWPASPGQQQQSPAAAAAAAAAAATRPAAAATSSHPRALPWPYPFGVDPIWKSASNELLFLNSIKMKLAVLIGFLHMLLGLCLSAANAINQKDAVSLLLTIVPQLFFFLCVVGFLCFLIVLKWVTPSNLFQKPSLIAVMIDFLMGTGGASSPELLLFQGQHQVQSILRLIMLFCVPLMFVGKPLFETYRNKKERREREGFEIIGSRGSSSAIQLQQLQQNHRHHHHHQQHHQQQLEERRRQRSSASLSPLVGDECEGEGEADSRFEGGSSEMEGEVWLHGLIEGIEFVLGTISNTASYLRLWALSLAHQQLSIVFFEKTVGAAFEPHQTAFQMTFKLLLGFPVFLFLTVFVMVSMEALECFLHALRLQWVEFQNKFYKGDGIAFQPLDLNRLPDNTTSS